MRLVLQLILMLALLPALVAPAAADPVVSIVFSANNGGTLIPCPVCGNNAVGGLARRATAFAGFRADPVAGPRTVFIAGPYELLAQDYADVPGQDAWPVLPKAFERLGYAAGCLSPVEAKNLAERKLLPPQGWKTLGNGVQTQVVESANGKIGLVFFPALETPEVPVSAEMIATIAREAAKLRPSVKLVVGVSGWGADNEMMFLEKAQGALDVLLGAGAGLAFSARQSADAKTLWMRSYTQGKAIYILDILAWPTASGFAWEAGSRYASRAMILDASFTSDPAMDALLKDVAPQGKPN